MKIFSLVLTFLMFILYLRVGELSNYFTISLLSLHILISVLFFYKNRILSAISTTLWMLVNCYYHLDLIFTMISTINGKALEVNNAQILFVIGIFTFILTFFLPGNGHFVLGSITGFWIALVYIFFSKYEDGQFNQILPETMNLTSLKFIYTDLWWITLACALVFFIAAGINDFNETSSSENKVEENKQNKQSKKKLTIKIQENKLNKSLQELDYLIGLSNVKQFMKELVNDALLFSERAKKGQSISDMSYHMIFLGPPGQERQRLLE